MVIHLFKRQNINGRFAFQHGKKKKELFKQALLLMYMLSAQSIAAEYRPAEVKVHHCSPLHPPPSIVDTSRCTVGPNEIHNKVSSLPPPCWRPPENILVVSQTRPNQSNLGVFLVLVSNCLTAQHRYSIA